MKARLLSATGRVLPSPPEMDVIELVKFFFTDCPPGIMLEFEHSSFSGRPKICAIEGRISFEPRHIVRRGKRQRGHGRNQVRGIVNNVRHNRRPTLIQS